MEKGQGKRYSSFRLEGPESSKTVEISNITDKTDKIWTEESMHSEVLRENPNTDLMIRVYTLIRDQGGARSIKAAHRK